MEESEPEPEVEEEPIVEEELEVDPEPTLEEPDIVLSDSAPSAPTEGTSKSKKKGLFHKLKKVLHVDKGSRKLRNSRRSKSKYSVMSSSKGSIYSK